MAEIRIYDRSEVTSSIQDFTTVNNIHTHLFCDSVAVDFEAIPLYNKIILGPETSKEVQKVTNEHMLHKTEKCAGKI